MNLKLHWICVCTHVYVCVYSHKFLVLKCPSFQTWRTLSVEVLKEKNKSVSTLICIYLYIFICVCIFIYIHTNNLPIHMCA